MQIVKYLVDHGANVNYKPRTGGTALWYTKNYNMRGGDRIREKIVSLLTERGGKIYPVRGRDDFYEGYR